jgi:O-antigen ligase
MITGTVRTRASFSFFSIVAVACALLSFAVSGGWGLILAVIAIIAGILGAVLALLPSRRGGFLSIVAVIAALVGAGAAIAKLLSRGV